MACLRRFFFPFVPWRISASLICGMACLVIPTLMRSRAGKVRSLTPPAVALGPGSSACHVGAVKGFECQRAKPQTFPWRVEPRISITGPAFRALLEGRSNALTSASPGNNSATGGELLADTKFTGALRVGEIAMPVESASRDSLPNDRFPLIGWGLDGVIGE